MSLHIFSCLEQIQVWECSGAGGGFCSRVHVLRKLSPVRPFILRLSASHIPKTRETGTAGTKGPSEKSAPVCWQEPCLTRFTLHSQFRPGFLTGSAPGFPMAESQMSNSMQWHRNCQSCPARGGPSTRKSLPVFISFVIQKVSSSWLLKCLSVSTLMASCHRSWWPLLSQRLAVLFVWAPTQSSICISICLSICTLQAQLPGWEVSLTQGTRGNSHSTQGDTWSWGCWTAGPHGYHFKSTSATIDSL